MQAAIQIQLEEICKIHPDKRVIMITFNNEVNIIGDGTNDDIIVVTGDKLSDQDKLLDIGKTYPIDDIKSVSESKESLKKKNYLMLKNMVPQLSALP